MPHRSCSVVFNGEALGQTTLWLAVLGSGVVDGHLRSTRSQRTFHPVHCGTVRALLCLPVLGSGSFDSTRRLVGSLARSQLPILLSCLLSLLDRESRHQGTEPDEPTVPTGPHDRFSNPHTRARPSGRGSLPCLDREEPVSPSNSFGQSLFQRGMAVPYHGQVSPV